MDTAVERRLRDEWMIGGSTLIDAYKNCPFVEVDGVIIDLTKECFTSYEFFILYETKK